MLWGLLGTACVIYTIVELLHARKLRATSPRPAQARPSPRADAGQRATSGGTPPPDVQFGAVDPPPPPVTLDRRTRHDPYKAQLKRRQTDR